jgi:dTDP-4-dehydrorhamnose 3,5-epimerase
MQQFSFEKTKLSGAFLIKPFIALDERGAFTKDYSEEVFEQNNIEHNLKEVFYTTSHKGVIRAIHFQREKQQAKLIRCIKGSIFDVIVDLRTESPTFGNWESFYLNEDNANEVYVPKYFGHGYLVLEESIVSYKCDEKFYGEFDDGIIWNDRDLNIQWPIQKIDNIILSKKDENLQSFVEYRRISLK